MTSERTSERYDNPIHVLSSQGLEKLLIRARQELYASRLILRHS